MTPFRGWLGLWQVLFDVFCAGIRTAFLNVRLFPSRVLLQGAHFYCTQYPEGKFARRFNRFHIGKSASTILTTFLYGKWTNQELAFSFGSKCVRCRTVPKWLGFCRFVVWYEKRGALLWRHFPFVA
jgi:hypothetical protein